MGVSVLQTHLDASPVFGHNTHTHTHTHTPHMELRRQWK